MANLSREQAQRLFQEKGAKTAAQRVQVMQRLKEKGHTVGGMGVQAQKQIAASQQQDRESQFDLGKAAMGTAGYVAGAVPRLFSGTAGELAGGIGDIAGGIAGAATGDFSQLGRIGQGIGRAALSPASGATSAVFDKTVGQIAGDAGEQAGAGMRRAGGGFGQMLGGLAEGAPHAGALMGIGATGALRGAQERAGLPTLSKDDIRSHFEGLGRAGEKLHKGRTALIGGAMQTAFSPATSMIEKTPIGQATQAIGGEYMKGAQMMGLSPEQAEGFAQIPGLLGGAAKLGRTPVSNIPTRPQLPSMQRVGGALKGAMKDPKSALYKTLDKTAPLTKPIRDISKASLAAQAKIAGIATKPFLRALKGLGKEALSRTSDLSKESMRFITKNPKMARDILKGKVSREENLNSVVGQIKNMGDDLQYTGKQYNPIRSSKQIVKFDTNPIDDIIANYKIKVSSKGRLSADINTKALTKTDIGKIQDIYNIYKGKKSLSADQVLTLRQKIDQMKVFKDGQSPAIKQVARELRGVVDKTAKKQIKGLEAIDNRYSAIIKDYKSLRKELFDAQGNLKTGAESKIANMANKSNVERLAKFEKTMPGIGDKIRSVRILEDIEGASGRRVASYTRSMTQGAAGFAGATGNLPAAAGLMGMQAITHPRLIANVLQKYGISKNKLKPIADELSGMLDDAFQKSIQRPASAVVSGVGQSLRKKGKKLGTGGEETGFEDVINQQ